MEFIAPMDSCNLHVLVTCSWLDEENISVFGTINRVCAHNVIKFSNPKLKRH